MKRNAIRFAKFSKVYDLLDRIPLTRFPNHIVICRRSDKQSQITQLLNDVHQPPMWYISTLESRGVVRSKRSSE